jgi:hypothetical protein
MTSTAAAARALAGVRGIIVLLRFPLPAARHNPAPARAAHLREVGAEADAVRAGPRREQRLADLAHICRPVVAASRQPRTSCTWGKAPTTRSTCRIAPSGRTDAQGCWTAISTARRAGWIQGNL